MRALCLLLIAPAVFGQTTSTPGLVTFSAGALSCGIVMRAQDQVQTYCYAPVLKLVHNTISTVGDSLIETFQWCVHQTTCSPVVIAWQFNLVKSVQTNGGIGWQYTVGGDSTSLKSGTLITVFGSPKAACMDLQLPWTGTTVNQDGAVVPLSIDHANGKICLHWWRASFTGWEPQNECGTVGVVNLFQLCPA